LALQGENLGTISNFSAVLGCHDIRQKVNPPNDNRSQNLDSQVDKDAMKLKPQTSLNTPSNSWKVLSGVGKMYLALKLPISCLKQKIIPPWPNIIKLLKS
jgi:hypothetical protein